jgi:hypothetical protein
MKGVLSMKRMPFVLLIFLLLCSACSDGSSPAVVLLRPPDPQPVYTNEPEVMTFEALTRFEFPSSDADMERLTTAREEKADAMARALLSESRYTQIYGETLHMEFYSGWLYLLQNDTHPATGAPMRYLVRTNGNMTERVGPAPQDGYEFVSFTFGADGTATLFYIGPGGGMFYSRYTFDIAWTYEAIEEYARYNADNPAAALPEESGTRNGGTPAVRVNPSDGRSYRAADNCIQVQPEDGQSWETVLTLGVETEIQMTQTDVGYSCTGFAINERGDMFLSVSEADTESDRMLTTVRRFRVNTRRSG